MARQELLDQRAVFLARWAAVTSHGVAYPVSSIQNAHDMLRHFLSLAFPTFVEYTVDFERRRRGGIDAPKHPVDRAVLSYVFFRQNTD